MPPSNNNDSSFINTSTIIAIVSTTALIYTQWYNVPDWMKQGSDGEEKARGVNDKDANDDLANPTAVLGKIGEMMSIVSNLEVSEEGGGSSGSGDGTRSAVADKHDADSMTEVQMMASVYSLIHLHRELRAIDPDYRDKLYDDDRDHDDVEVDELQELAEYLEYAHWAYESSHTVISKYCRQAELDLIRHDTATEPGRVGHFVAVDHKKKLAILGLKGTSTLSDVLTDLIAIPKEHVGCYFDDDTFAAPPQNASKSEKATEKMMCHEGIFTAAIWMADSIQPMVENLFVPLGYKLVICGHSLGAGTACLLGLELRSRITAFRKNYTDLRVLAFASPPVLSYKASKACAPFVTTMVNNSDVIPRSSVSNLVVMSKLLVRVNERLEANGMNFGSWTSLRKFYDAHSKIDDDLLITEKELDDFFDETHAAPEDDTESLYVPGRVVVMWDKGDNDNNEMGGIVTDCGMKQLRQVELSLTLVADHLVNGYRENLKKLIDQLDNTI